jgi:hypothetical protein
MKTLPLILMLLLSGNAFADTLNCSITLPDGNNILQSANLDSNGDADLKYSDGKSYNIEVFVVGDQITTADINNTLTGTWAASEAIPLVNKSIVVMLGAGSSSTSLSCALQ